MISDIEVYLTGDFTAAARTKAIPLIRSHLLGQRHDIAALLLARHMPEALLDNRLAGVSLALAETSDANPDTKMRAAYALCMRAANLEGGFSRAWGEALTAFMKCIENSAERAVSDDPAQVKELIGEITELIESDRLLDAALAIDALLPDYADEGGIAQITQSLLRQMTATKHHQRLIVMQTLCKHAGPESLLETIIKQEASALLVGFGGRARITTLLHNH